MPSPAYIREVVEQWARTLPEPKPLTDEERAVLAEMLKRQPQPERNIKQ